MYGVELYARVRRACHVDDLSIREAARRFGLDRRTVAKMLRHSVPRSTPGSSPCAMPNGWSMPSAPSPDPKAVLPYLARYTHRVAISNRRLIQFEKGNVTFKCKDYRREGDARYKTMTLAAR